ncbi:MAG: YfhO family protein [Niabella sp.]
MNNKWINNVLPHVVAIAIFLLAAVVFCRPVMEGKALNQHDIIGWKGAAQNAFEVKEKTGRYPLWNTNVFSGMPNFQIAMDGDSALPDIYKIISLGLPKPMNYFFVAALCFYILCCTLGLRPVVGILGALAYAYSAYNPIIISAGHETKMMAICFMPLLLSGILLIFQKRYWLGLAVATLGAVYQINANHPQITYYLLLCLVLIAIVYVVYWIRSGELKHLIIAGCLSVIAGLLGLGVYAISYMPTKEYTEYTMRGGKDVEVKSDGTVAAASTKGLDEDYAFRYSMNITEPLVMLMPRAFGESSMQTLPPTSNVVKKLSAIGVPEGSAEQLATSLPAYWGGMSGPGEMTSGPPYVGAIIFILALIGFVIIKHPLKWALLAATVLSVVLSWGKFFPGVNNLLFHYLPMYNKFRAPSMALVMASLTLPVMAVLTIQYLFFSGNIKTQLDKYFKPILYTCAGLIVVLGLIYIGQSYNSPIDQQLLANKWDESGSPAIGSAIVAGLKADRQSLFGMQLLRTLLFVLVVLGVIYLYLKNIFKPMVAVAVLLLVSFADLWIFDKKYLPDEAYVPKDDTEAINFVKTAVDAEILKDTSAHYRVLQVGGFDDNRASYFHRSVLGYHAAKLRVYQDVIEKYLSGQPNQQVLNALDTRYFILRNPQNGQESLMPNPNAYGAAWFVKTVLPAKDKPSQLQEIGNVNLKDTAVLLQEDAGKIGAITPADSSSVINLSKYENDHIVYHTKSSGNHFAVLSEVYYPAGWNAYVDGKATPIYNTNFFMRGVVVPSGDHTVELKFEPSSYIKGNRITYISSYLVIIVVLGSFFMAWWTDRKKKPGSVLETQHTPL